MITPISNLSEYINALGKAYIYTTDTPTVAGSWALLGITEGDIQVEEGYQYNDYKLPEWTGEAVHERNIDGQSLKVTAPLIWGNADLYDTIAPSGSKGGGRSAPMAVTTHTVLVIPAIEVGDGLSYDGTSWSPAAPDHALWIHRATFEPGSYSFKHGDGGKVIRQVGIQALFDDNRPEGQKLYTVGNPVTQGITTYRL